MWSFFPKQVYLWGSLLEKNRLDTLLGALGLVGRGFWLCWASWLGWAWGLAVLGALAGLGVVLGVLGALAGLGVVLGVGFGRAGRARWVGRGVGRGVWPCCARWLGWAWFQSTKVDAGNTKVDFQSTKVYSRSTKVYFPSTKVYSRSTQVYFHSTKVYSGSTKVYSGSTKVYFQSTKVYFQITQVYFQRTKVYCGNTKVYCGEKTQKQGCWECYLIQLIYLRCLGSMLVSFQASISATLKKSMGDTNIPLLSLLQWPIWCLHLHCLKRSFHKCITLKKKSHGEFQP